MFCFLSISSTFLLYALVSHSSLRSLELSSRSPDCHLLPQLVDPFLIVLPLSLVLDFRLGRLGDPGVSPPPRQGSFVVFYLKTGLGTRPNLFGLAPLNPEVGFHMVVTGNAITNECDWSGI